MAGELHVYDVGMATSLGYSYEIGAAAARAGLSRARPLDSVFATDPATGEREMANGHLVPGADGYQGLGRLIRMSVPALTRFEHKTNPIDWSRTALFINFSDSYFVTAVDKADLIEQGESPESVDFDDTRAGYLQSVIQASYLERLREHLTWFGEPVATRFHFGGGTGFVSGFEWAARAMLDDRVDSVVVGAVDSMVDPFVLDCLAQLQLLKTPTVPDGFMPGEAAAFFLCHSEQTADPSRARFSVGGAASADEGIERFDEAPPTGRALAHCLGATMAAIEGAGSRVAFLSNGTNGDFYKSHDWGCALLQFGQNPQVSSVTNVFPAMSFGEAGAAAAPVAAAMAGWFLSKRTAGGSSAPVFVQDYGGARASFYVRRER